MSRPSLRTAFTTFWEYDAPLATRLKLVVQNNLIKVRTGSICCGHPGQPGC